VILLARHGQTEFNVERRLQGRLDSPLTALGVRQAQAMAGLLADLTRIEGGSWRLVASPLGRTMETARIIGERLALPIEPEARLAEIDVGAWAGRLRSEIERDWPDAFNASGWAFRAPMGETFEHVERRCRDWLEGQPPEPERRIIAVSHGIAGRVLRGVYAGLGYEETVDQQVPQDAVFRLSAGQIDRFDCEPLEA
jgi:probable phosphoglycerate mutase